MVMFLPDMITTATAKDWEDFWHGPDLTDIPNIRSQTNMISENQKFIYKNLFTDSEWQIIDYALSEYQDHLDEGDNETEIYDSIQTKLNAIFS